MASICFIYGNFFEFILDARIRFLYPQLMSQLTILSLDDKDFITQTAIARSLTPKWKVELVSSYDESLSALRKRHFDVLLLDNDLGTDSPSGIELIQIYRNEFPHLMIIIVTNDDELQEMKQALVLGAEDYIVKSGSICEDILLKIPECLNRAKNRKLVEAYREELKPEDPLSLMGTSQAVKTMREAFRVEKLRESHIVLTGEIGSGKTSLAKHFWKLKDDPCRSFITFKFSKIPKSRLEADLFGTATGKNGIFFQSHLGDLLIPDFNHASKTLQRKIIESAVSKSITPRGSLSPIPIQNRLLLTSTEIPKLTKKSRIFRHICLPPLRERLEDIGAIATAYLGRYKMKQYHLSEKALEFLQSQQWHGNIKQLLRVLDQVTSDLKADKREKIDVPDFLRAERQHSLNTGALEIPLPRNQSEVNSHFFNTFIASCERSVIIHALSLFNGNVVSTSSALGLSRSTFYRKLEELKISADQIARS